MKSIVISPFIFDDSNLCVPPPNRLATFLLIFFKEQAFDFVNFFPSDFLVSISLILVLVFIISILLTFNFTCSCFS